MYVACGDQACVPRLVADSRDPLFGVSALPLPIRRWRGLGVPLPLRKTSVDQGGLQPRSSVADYRPLQ
jgi:hypothetical protein